MSSDDLKAAAFAARYFASTAASIHGLLEAGLIDDAKKLADELAASYPKQRAAITLVAGELKRTRKAIARFGDVRAPTAHEAAVEMVLVLNRERFGLEVIGRKSIEVWPNVDEVIAEIELEYAKAKSPPKDEGDPPVDWNDFRNGPDGNLLTVKVCEADFAVTGKDLSTDKEAKRTRRKNPNGRGHVYRYDVVSRLSNRKGLE